MWRIGGIFYVDGSVVIESETKPAKQHIQNKAQEGNLWKTG